MRADVKPTHIKTAYANHEEMCASDVDAVLIFTERVHHFPFAKLAMQSGKHVYTAVPMANTLEDRDGLRARRRLSLHPPRLLSPGQHRSSARPRLRPPRVRHRCALRPRLAAIFPGACLLNKIFQASIR
ncbi:MAG: Gfo/Idh/MocA family oxidoreductase [Opitutales bacterium]